MKRTRRRSKKEGVPAISPYSIARRVYTALAKDTKQMIDTIHVQQAQHTDSPNFFYKGETYILNNSLPVNALVTDLRTDLDSYLEVVALNENVVKTFKFAISRLISSEVTYSDLYYVFPESGHHFLEGIPQVDREPDYVANLLSKPDVPGIVTLVQEQALYELIG